MAIAPLGGAIYDTGALTLTGCSFTNNAASPAYAKAAMAFERHRQPRKWRAGVGRRNRWSAHRRFLHIYRQLTATGGNERDFRERARFLAERQPGRRHL